MILCDPACQMSCSLQAIYCAGTGILLHRGARDAVEAAHLPAELPCQRPAGLCGRGRLPASELAPVHVTWTSGALLSRTARQCEQALGTTTGHTRDLTSSPRTPAAQCAGRGCGSVAGAAGGPTDGGGLAICMAVPGAAAAGGPSAAAWRAPHLDAAQNQAGPLGQGAEGAGAMCCFDIRNQIVARSTSFNHIRSCTCCH